MDVWAAFDMTDIREPAIALNPALYRGSRQLALKTRAGHSPAIPRRATLKECRSGTIRRLCADAGCICAWRRSADFRAPDINALWLYGTAIYRRG